MKSKRHSFQRRTALLHLLLFCILWPIPAALLAGNDDDIPLKLAPLSLEIPKCPDAPKCSFWIDGKRVGEYENTTEDIERVSSAEVVTVELRDSNGRTIDFQDLPLSPTALRELQARNWALGATFGLYFAPKHPFRMRALAGKGYSVSVNGQRTVDWGFLIFEYRRDRESRISKETESLIDYRNESTAIGLMRVIPTTWQSAPPVHVGFGSALRYGRIETTQSLRTITNNEEGNSEILRSQNNIKGYEFGIGIRLFLLIPATDNVWFPLELSAEQLRATNQSDDKTISYTKVHQSIGLQFVF